MGSSHTELLTGNLSSKGNHWLKCVMWLLSLGVLLVIVGDGEGFEGLIHYLAPEWVTPSTVTEHVEKHFEKKKDALRVKLARSDILTLALTSDCWTALTTTWLGDVVQCAPFSRSGRATKPSVEMGPSMRDQCTLYCEPLWLAPVRQACWEADVMHLS